MSGRGQFWATGVFVALLLGPVEPGRAERRPALSRAEIREGERRLSGLGYWTGAIDGVWDAASRHALVAFQKVEGRRRTGILTRAELDALALATTPLPRETGGFHLEVDVARQVLFVVDSEGRAGNILPISSGSGKTFRERGYPEGVAVTPCAHLEVYRKARGRQRSPLGELINPLYVVGGIAIHGSGEVPAFPASHGCIRIPLFASERLFDLVPPFTPVFVYGCPEEVPPPAAQVPPVPAVAFPVPPEVPPPLPPPTSRSGWS